MIFVWDLVILGEIMGLGIVIDVVFLFDNKYLYVVDMMNGCIWVFWYDIYEVFGSFGCNGCYVG